MDAASDSGGSQSGKRKRAPPKVIVPFQYSCKCGEVSCEHKVCLQCRDTSYEEAWARYNKEGEAEGNECGLCRNFFNWKHRGDKKKLADAKAKQKHININDAKHLE